MENKEITKEVEKRLRVAYSEIIEVTKLVKSLSDEDKDKELILKNIKIIEDHVAQLKNYTGEINNSPIKKCPYCGTEVVEASNKEIYGREYGNGKCLICKNKQCKAYVLVNDDGTPFGAMADKELVNLRKEAKALLEAYWVNGKYKRQTTFEKLALKLGLRKHDCVIAKFDKETTLRAIDVLKKGL